MEKKTETKPRIEVWRRKNKDREMEFRVSGAKLSEVSVRFFYLRSDGRNDFSFDEVGLVAGGIVRRISKILRGVVMIAVGHNTVVVKISNSSRWEEIQPQIIEILEEVVFEDASEDVEIIYRDDSEREKNLLG